MKQLFLLENFYVLNFKFYICKVKNKEMNLSMCNRCMMMWNNPQSTSIT